MPDKKPIKITGGMVFRAQQHCGLEETRPSFAYVPLSLLKLEATTKDGAPQVWALNERGYQTKRWDSINCGANSWAPGSHILPDLTQPISKEELANPNQELNEFLKGLTRLYHKALGSESEPTKPALSRERT